MAEIDIYSYDPCGFNCDPEMLAHHEVDGNIGVEVQTHRKTGKEYTVLSLPSPELVGVLVSLVSQLPIDKTDTVYGYSVETDEEGLAQAGGSASTLYSGTIDDKSRVVFRLV